MGYISNKGILAEPIQLNGYTVKDNNRVWIIPKETSNGVFGIHFKDDSQNDIVDGHYFPIFASTPTYDEKSWDQIKHGVATMQWVADNFLSNGDGDVPAFDPTKYVTIVAFNSLESIVDSNIIRIQALENKILDKLRLNF